MLTSLIHWLLDSLIPWFLASLIPWFLDSMIPWFLAALILSCLASLIHWFLDSLVPCFLDSSIPWFLDSLIPWFLDSWIPWCMASLKNIILPKIALRWEIARGSGLCDFTVFVISDCLISLCFVFWLLDSSVFGSGLHLLSPARYPACQSRLLCVSLSFIFVA